jgi:tetratricopeptide (TPR) repeat protein
MRKFYEPFREALRKHNFPKSLFAQLKYTLALADRQEEIDPLKRRLRSMAQEETYYTPATYYLLTIEAYQARLAGDNEQALLLIDSAFQYSPGFWESQRNSLDKSLMLADIYEEKGLYTLSIARLENIPVTPNFPFVKGYATYRLSQLYELNGQVEESIAKCEMLIQDFQACDARFRPWVEECTIRRDRLQRLKG